MKNIVGSLRSHPGNSSESAAERNLTDFCMSWSKVKPNQTKNPTKPPAIWRWGVYIASVSTLQKAYPRQWKLTDWTEAPCAVVMPKAWADKWFSIQDPVITRNWFTRFWHIISLSFCSSSAKQHTFSVEKKPAVNTFLHFSVWRTNTCHEEWQMKYSWVGLKYLPISLLQTQCLGVQHLNNQG